MRLTCLVADALKIELLVLETSTKCIVRSAQELHPVRNFKTRLHSLRRFSAVSSDGSSIQKSRQILTRTSSRP